MKSTNEAIDIIGCSRGTVSHYVKNNILTVSEKKGRKLFFTDDSVEKAKVYYLENLENNVPQAERKPKTTDILLADNIEDHTDMHTLNDLGRQIMADTIDEMKLLGIYRVNDNYAIYDYAKTYQTYINYSEKATEHPTQTIKGVMRISPYFTLVTTYSKMVDEKRKRLGLDPASRQKLTVKEKKEIDEMAEMFK